VDEEEDWNELDQVSVEKGIREHIYDMPEDDYQKRFEALSKLRSIVMDKIAKGFYMSFSHIMQTHPKETVAEARTIVERLAPDLNSLGLAIKHPDTAEPMKLTLSKTPPGEDESWFQLEPMTAGSSARSVRLPSPLPFLYLCEAPTTYSGQSKGFPSR